MIFAIQTIEKVERLTTKPVVVKLVCESYHIKLKDVSSWIACHDVNYFPSLNLSVIKAHSFARHGSLYLFEGIVWGGFIEHATTQFFPRIEASTDQHVRACQSRKCGQNQGLRESLAIAFLSVSGADCENACVFSAGTLACIFLTRCSPVLNKIPHFTLLRRSSVNIIKLVALALLSSTMTQYNVSEV